MASLNPLPPSINPKRSKRCEKKSCLSNPGSLEAPRAAEKAGGTKSKVGVKVTPITSIKPKIIGLVLLPGGRIQFFLHGTYSPMMGESQGRLSIQSLHNSRPSCHQCQVIVCSTTSIAKTSRPQQR